MRLKNNLKGGETKEEDERMTTFTYAGRRYYTTRKEVEKARRKTDVVYYSKSFQAYYIKKANKKLRFRLW